MLVTLEIITRSISFLKPEDQKLVLENIKNELQQEFEIFMIGYKV